MIGDSKQSVAQRAQRPVRGEEQLLKKYEHLAHAVVRKHRGNASYQDLVQIAKIGVLEAIRTHDGQVASLTTHAYNRAMFAVSHYARGGQDDVIRIPEKLWADRDKPEVHAQIPQRAFIEAEDIGAASDDDFAASADARVLASSALSRLSEIERRVIECVLLDEHTHMEATEILGISRWRVYAALRDGTAKLRNYLSAVKI
ncbi:hypothetical protein CCAX7_25830 [Capsulimonas corticalis]|uniref:Uncharacterized protein n=2 Tax=Capsulimonas corticalis TaxID=2219043 RepID=A0A402CVW5_9BACT|nr:hypothetical protein CCAX7_25830 [Capsulimonas corticalis]